MSKKGPPELYPVLQAKYPRAFPAQQRDIRPLMVGIRETLVSELGQDKAQEITDCLRWHCGSLAYKRALTLYRVRLDLSGAPCGEVTAEHRALALQAVERIKAKAAARKARPAPPVVKPEEPARLGLRPVLRLKKSAA